MSSRSVTHPVPAALRDALDAAVAPGSVEQIVPVVKERLEDLIREGSVELPEELCRPRPDTYARRLLYANDELGYSVLVMTWGPGQGTPLHDHAGLWCVEGVWRGRLEVVQYDLVEERDGRCRFVRQESATAGVGSAGSLIPPYEYHTIANALDTPSVTLHVYGGEMDHCSVFLPEEGDWYRREERRLSLH